MAPGIAEALFTTAFGLIAAIPAVVAYNKISSDIDRYAKRLVGGGTMLLSGFYEEDIPVVQKAAEAVGLEYQSYTECNRWVCVKLGKPCAE